MCDSAAIYQLRFATASERRFCLAVVAKPCKIIAQQSRSWIFTLQFFEVKLRWFLTPSSANSAQLYSFCFPPSHNGVSFVIKIAFTFTHRRYNASQKNHFFHQKPLPLQRPRAPNSCLKGFLCRVSALVSMGGSRPCILACKCRARDPLNMS